MKRQFLKRIFSGLNLYLCAVAKFCCATASLRKQNAKTLFLHKICRNRHCFGADCVCEIDKPAS